jgi:Uma2 family endonuclease
MLAQAKFTYKTPQKYLNWEALQKFCHEYLRGQIFAMNKETILHNLIGLNLATLLKGHLQGNDCQMFMTDVKVKIALASSFHYLDVMVSCDARDRDAVQFIQFPCFIAEVLSTRTEAYERGEKFRCYRQLSRMIADLFSRNAQGRWEPISYGEGDLFSLSSLNWRSPPTSLHEDVIFTT